MLDLSILFRENLKKAQNLDPKLMITLGGVYVPKAIRLYLHIVRSPRMFITYFPGYTQNYFGSTHE